MNLGPMTLDEPGLLWLAIVCLLLWLPVAGLQRRALRVVEDEVHPRFRALLTRHDRDSLRRHLILLLNIAVLLVLATTRPSLPLEYEEAARGDRVLLMIDASASMYATDVPPLPEAAVTAPPPADGENAEPRPPNRIDHARALAGDLVLQLDATRFALASFSGEPTIHLPLTDDVDQILSALATLETHGFYRRTGSSLSGALDGVFHFVDPRRPGLQVVLIGDGELPYDEAYDDLVAALGEQGIAVHGLTVGSLAGQTRRIFDFKDVVAGVDEPRVLREYSTFRVDEHYRRIAEATGGRFEVGVSGEATSEGSVERVAEAIRAYRPPAPLQPGAPRREITPLLLLAALLGFLVESLVLGRRRPRGALDFDVRRLGRSAATGLVVLLPVFLACAESPLEQAHRANEVGIAEDALRRFTPARRAFERSRGFGVQPEVPTYNLARTLTRDGAYSEAHETFQQALELAPELAEAHYNDGIALFLWGREERDPRDCDLERTQDLWRAAHERFLAAGEHAEPGGDLAVAADENRRALNAHLAEIARLIADPPPGCFGGGGSESPDTSEDSGGDAGGGDEDQTSEESGGGGGGEDQDSGGGGGGGGDEDGDGDSDAHGGGDEDASGGGDQDQNDQRGERDEDEADTGAGGTAPEDEDDEQNGGAGEGPSGPTGGGPPDDPRAPLSAADLETIRQALERIGQQGFEPGKYHRRTLSEQFPPSAWEEPDPEIWW